jgi:TetR/AcrR family transcriptional repressor of nem operon
MRYDSDHKARTHRRIVKNAARQLRTRGLNGPGVASLMKASGLTVGGFYKHFQSKDHLLVEALEEGLDDFGEKVFAAMDSSAPGEQWKEIVRFYLSVDHCENPGDGCPMAALAPEISRATPAVKKRIAEIMKTHRARLLEFMPGDNPESRLRSFIIIFTAMAGAISMARTMPNPEEKRKILVAVRDHLLASF